MAWTAPSSWTAGQTVTAADMNAQVWANLEHIGGLAGFTATGSSSGHGVEPKAGYFAGATLPNYHLEGGTWLAGANSSDSTGRDVSFSRAFLTTSPAVVLSVVSTNPAVGIQIGVTYVSSAKFGLYCATTSAYGSWLAWGSDT